MGVKRAVDTVLDVARHRGRNRVFTYGPIIHNPQTVELLQRRGVSPADTMQDIDGGIVVIRAHGITPEEKEALSNKDVTLCDATCPRVSSVQSIIRKHASSGYTVIIAGDSEHPEVKGLMGYAAGRGVVVRNSEAVDELPPYDKVCVVAQTTQNLQEYQNITEAIHEKYADATVFDTICRSTEKRQNEVRELARDMDAMIIVGGRNSANTQRLAAISQAQDTPTYHVETAEELKAIDLSRYDRVGISAGASTPNWIIDGVVDYLLNYRDGKGTRRLPGLYALWILGVRTDLYSAIGAGCLSLVGMLFQDIGISLIDVMIAATSVYALHTINRLQDRNLGRITGSFRESTYIRHRGAYQTIALLALVVALALAAVKGALPLVLLMLMSLFGALYNITIFPARWGCKRLADIPGSKNLFTAAAWGLVTVLIPQSAVSLEVTMGTVMAFLFVFNIVFVKSALSDMLDIQSDRLVGRETIPVVMGEKPTRKLLQVISILTGVIMITAAVTGYAPWLSLALLASIFYIWICLGFYDRKTQFSNIVLEGLLGTNYLIAGVGALIWLIAARYMV